MVVNTESDYGHCSFKNCFIFRDRYRRTGHRNTSSTYLHGPPPTYRRQTHFENRKSLPLLRHGNTPGGIVHDAAPCPFHHTASLHIQSGFTLLTYAGTQVSKQSRHPSDSSQLVLVTRLLELDATGRLHREAACKSSYII